MVDHVQSVLMALIYTRSAKYKTGGDFMVSLYWVQMVDHVQSVLMALI